MGARPCTQPSLVTGASAQPKRLARQLAAQGVAVTSADRSVPARNAWGSIQWYDMSTHPARLAGAERMYLIRLAATRSSGRYVPFLEEAREAGVRRAVLLSNSASLGWTGHRRRAPGDRGMFDEWAVLRRAGSCRTSRATTCMPRASAPAPPSRPRPETAASASWMHTTSRESPWKPCSRPRR